MLWSHGRKATSRLQRSTAAFHAARLSVPSSSAKEPMPMRSPSLLHCCSNRGAMRSGRVCFVGECRKAHNGLTVAYGYTSPGVCVTDNFLACGENEGLCIHFPDQLSACSYENPGPDVLRGPVRGTHKLFSVSGTRLQLLLRSSFPAAPAPARDRKTIPLPAWFPTD